MPAHIDWTQSHCTPCQVGFGSSIHDHDHKESSVSWACWLWILRAPCNTAIMKNVSIPRSLQESLNATKVSYTQVGNSGLHVSVPVLGAMSFGTSFYQLVTQSTLTPMQGTKIGNPGSLTTQLKLTGFSKLHSTVVSIRGIQLTLIRTVILKNWSATLSENTICHVTNLFYSRNVTLQ